jgi:hypothetical protein
MNQNKLSFQSEELVVDYISFKFQYLDDSTYTNITNYLFKIGFNSYQRPGKYRNSMKLTKLILVHPKNQVEVCFVVDNPYWTGTLLQFPSLSAAGFYSLVQKN